MAANAPFLRALLCGLLGGVGHAPIAAGDRYEIDRVAGREAGRIRAAIMACGADNPAAAAAVRRRIPGVSVVALGYPVSPDDPYLPLPVKPSALLLTLAELIAADRLANQDRPAG